MAQENFESIEQLYATETNERIDAIIKQIGPYAHSSEEDYLKLEIVPTSFKGGCGEVTDPQTAVRLAESVLWRLRLKLNGIMTREKEVENGKIEYWEFHTIPGAGDMFMSILRIREENSEQKDIMPEAYISKTIPKGYAEILESSPEKYTLPEASVEPQYPVRGWLKKFGQALLRPFQSTPTRKP